MIYCNMHLRLVFGGPHQMTLKRFMLGLLLSTAACAVPSVDAQFDVVARGKLFVDRSLLIDRFLGGSRTYPWTANHRVIIGARKSGKSTNLSMLKQFFGVFVDESGQALAPNTTKHYALFKSLKIGQRPAFEQCFARIPVIHLNLAEFVVTGSEKDFKKSFCKIIRSLITEHRYLLQSEVKHVFRGEKLKTYVDIETCHNESIFSLKHFGEDLARLMQNHFQTRVLVLIDEIDIPAMSVLDSNVTSVSNDFISDVFTFVRLMLQNNWGDVMGSFWTGATLQGVFFRSMRTYNDYGFEKKLKYFYGVTENEVRRLLSISGIPMTKTLMQELREMYGGYGATDAESKEFVYNTQSIIKFCEGKVIRPYWDAAPGIVPFRKLLSPERDGRLVEKAMHSEVKVASRTTITAEGLLGTKDFLTGKNEKLPIFSWNVQGYLRESGVFANSPGKRSMESGGRCAAVPNTENRLILLDTVLNKDYYKAKHSVNEKHVQEFVMSVSRLNASGTSINQLAESISNLFVNSTKHLKNEAVFRYPLYSFLRQANQERFSKVTAELGRKTQRKSDIIVGVKDRSTVFIGLTLDQESGQDALRQVLEDEQLQEYSKKTSQKFICLGVNLLRLDSRCDVSYLIDSVNFKDSQNVTRWYYSTLDEKASRPRSWWEAIFMYP